jgi:hypothetical protein
MLRKQLGSKDLMDKIERTYTIIVNYEFQKWQSQMWSIRIADRTEFVSCGSANSVLYAFYSLHMKSIQTPQKLIGFLFITAVDVHDIW